jgi:hypothetical protein
MAAVLGLAACGGTSDGGTDGAGATAATEGAAPTTAAPASPPKSGAPAKLTPPGKHLKLGQAATVGWVPLSQATGTGAKKGIKIQVVVESIKKGKISDFSNVKLNSSQRKATPYYVQVRIKALTKTRPKGTDDPHIALRAIDDRDQAQGRIIVIGAFPACDVTAAPKPFVSGKSYTTCLAYLMPGGGSIEKVAWGDGPAKANDVTAYFSKPVVWS